MCWDCVGNNLVRLSQFSISQMIRVEREKFKWWIVIIVWAQFLTAIPISDGPTYAPLTALRKIWVNGLAKTGSSFGTISFICGVVM